MNAVSGAQMLKSRKKMLVVMLALPFALLLVFSNSVQSATQEPPVRVNDLAYGSVLYEFYQGHAFEALSGLNVAKLRDGIVGHGDHPALVEGGLMLSYGMTQAAKTLFESVLDESDKNSLVSEAQKNQAWFYLAKVFYLERKYPLSLETFGKIDQQVLQESNEELLYELFYLKGQISLQSKQADTTLKQQIEYLPDNHILQNYLRYNYAVELIQTSELELATSALDDLLEALNKQIADLVKWRGDSKSNQALWVELTALKEQCLLSLGQLHLQNKDHQTAFDYVKLIRKDSVFSDQALFAYSVAATNLKQYEYALEALNALKDRELFSPWLQQVPYALAYLYEQLDESELAIQAYLIAASHYEQLVNNLTESSEKLTEQKVLSAFNLDEDIGRESVVSDAYGNLTVEPQDFNMAMILSSEVFQRSLSELHELYRLKYSLSRWSKQLDSFDGMMDTRSQLRRQKIQLTQASLEAQQAESWVEQQSKFINLVRKAKESENSQFFMTEEQIDYFNYIQGVFHKLESFPEGVKKAAFLKRIERIKAYFEWSVSEQYSVNLWRAEKQISGLNKAMKKFQSHHRNLQKELLNENVSLAFSKRIESGRERLANLEAELALSLNAASGQLLTQVRAELNKQKLETKNYLLAAQKAHARLSDALFMNTQNSSMNAQHSGINSQNSGSNSQNLSEKEVNK